MKSSIERETSVGVVKIPIGVVTKGEDRYSISNFFHLFHLFWAFLLSRIYYRKELSCKKVIYNLKLLRFWVFLEFRRVTVPHQRYRHSTTRLLCRGKLLSQISLIMIVDVSGHLCLSSGGSTVADSSLFCFLLIIAFQRTLLQQGWL